MNDLPSLEQQLQEATAEVELTLEKLHLVQEELEHYYNAHQKPKQNFSAIGMNNNVRKLSSKLC